jgi:hypothetical protein
MADIRTIPVKQELVFPPPPERLVLNTLERCTQVCSLNLKIEYLKTRMSLAAGVV